MEEIVRQPFRIFAFGCAFATLMLAAGPADAGGSGIHKGMQKGHAGAHRSVSGHRRASAYLPNGVTIFDRRNTGVAPPAHRSGGAKRAPGPAAGKSAPRGRDGHRRPATTAAHAPRPEPGSKGFKPGHGKPDHGRPGYGKRRHGKPGHRVRPPVYAVGVYAAAPDDTYQDPADRYEEECRFLTERGYDRAGRRVLVEWTVCFDQGGSAYVPDGGRRILAYY